MTTYNQIKTSIDALSEAPQDLVSFFNEYSDIEAKNIAYYCLAIKFPDSLVEILTAYHGKALEYEIPVAEPKKKAATKKASGTTKRPGRQITIINDVTGEKHTLDKASELTKEGNPTGVVFSRGDRDAIVYYGKTKHGFKLVVSE